MPIFEGDDVILETRVVILLGEDFVLLNMEEMANFFIKIRSHPDFTAFGNGEEYFPSVAAEFMGNFFIEKKKNHAYELSYMNYTNFMTYEILFPNHDMVTHILSLEGILTNIMVKKHHFEEEKIDLMCKLEEIRLMCNSPMHIKTIAKHTSDTFVIEMATNLFSFFIKYYENKRE